MGEREAWVCYLEGDILGKTIAGCGNVYELKITVSARGLRAIIKTRLGDEYFVCFVGAGTLPGLSAKVRNVVIGDGTNMRIDAYPPI